MTKIIAFEGIDASGKNTQARLLAEALEERGFSVRMASFPREQTPVGNLIRQELKDGITIGKEAFHLLYEVDRLAHLHSIEEDLDNIDYLILDRYTMSNIAYGMVNGLNQEWLIRVQSVLPKPDCTFFLDISVEESVKRRGDRLDSFESDLEFLGRVSNAYRLIGKDKSMRPDDSPVLTVNAPKHSAQDIHELILENVLSGKLF